MDLNRKVVIGVCALIAVVGAAYLGYSIGIDRGSDLDAVDGSDAGGREDRPVLYWHDPMVPGQRFDRPGKSPFMDMELVPVYADDAPAGSVVIDPRVQQNLGIRTAEAVTGTLERGFSAVGSITFNERTLSVVAARADGYVERLHVRAELDHVEAGQPLADLYVPAWVAAQEEFLAVRQMQSAELKGSLVDAARQRMELVGMTAAQIAQVAARRTVEPRLTIVSPVAGVVTELLAREGTTVSSGSPLFRINSLSNVWIDVQIPERLGAQVKPGMAVEAQVPALSGVVLRGTVDTLLPQVSAVTRTTAARVEIANPDGRLVPGMFATVQFSNLDSASALLVPSDAVIRTGKRTVVMLLEGEGRFRPVEVEAGAEGGGQTAIVSGLKPGDRVVVSGQFLIDSESSLRATETRMAAPAEAEAPASVVHHGEGVVNAISGNRIILAHGPIQSLGWGSMTMPFRLQEGNAAAVNPGDRVSFDFVADEGGEYILTTLTKLPAPEPR